MALVEQLEGADHALDFEKLLPTPADLLDPERPEPGMFPGWYSWRREHWGVKSNATSVRRRGYGRCGRVRYRFVTAYGPPMALLDHVAARWPEVSLELTYEVEMMGSGAAAWAAGQRASSWEQNT